MFRTPLNAVIGYSEIVIENLEQGDKNPQKKVDLLRINAAGKHLLSLLTDVLKHRMGFAGLTMTE